MKRKPTRVSGKQWLKKYLRKIARRRGLVKWHRSWSDRIVGIRYKDRELAE